MVKVRHKYIIETCVLMDTTDGLLSWQFLQFLPIRYIIFDQKQIIFPQKGDTQKIF